MFVQSVNAESYITVTYYMNVDNVRKYVTPINGIIRFNNVKKESWGCLKDVWGKYDLYGNYPKNDITDNTYSDCTPSMRKLLNKFEGDMTRLFGFSNPEGNTVAVVNIEKTKQVFLFISYYSGGSGGGEISWSIYNVRDEVSVEKLFPFLSGIEVTPGGGGWYSLYCNGKNEESYEECAERYFYPKKNVYQIIFTDKGIISRPLPNSAEIQLE